jgi:NAD(P)-dependent dehydrogenase (short-subunit alcohol dehydrogenase family)
LIQALGCESLTLPTDVSDVTSVKAMVHAAADHFGRLDILVNGAGINIRQPVDNFTEDDWDRLMAVNLKGAFFASTEAATRMRQQGKGKIINVGSVAYEIILPNIALYAISKGGMRQMTRSLAVEWAKDNIYVNSIAPGRFWTKMTDAVFSDETLRASAVSPIPLGRPGTASDLAGVTMLLASDASDYITGQTIFVDGGWLVQAGVKA